MVCGVVLISHYSFEDIILIGVCLVIFNDKVISKPKIVGNSNDTINKSSMGLGGAATSPSHSNNMERYD